jgi:hypothetical protein
METLEKILAVPYASLVLLMFVLAGMWRLLPLLVDAGRAIIRFFINFCFALFALAFIGFVAFGMIRTLFYPYFAS